MSENNQQQDPNNQQQQQEEEMPEEIELAQESPIKRIFHYERVDKSKKYYKNQSPPGDTGNFIDNIFLQNESSLRDNSPKSTGVDKINIKQIDWKRASDLFKDKLTLFPPLSPDNKEGEQFHQFKINFRKNKGELFSHYTQFFHAMNLLTSIPNLIENIFECKEINEQNYYTLYIYINGDYQKLILDDFLPLVKDTMTLRFAKPDKEEIWLPLLEKAFAKTHGGYGSLITCDVAEVFQCFTGVPVEKFNIADLDDEDLRIAMNNCRENYVFLEPKKDICKEIGIIEGKAYQLKEINDLGENENKDKSNIILKIYNMFEYNQYKGKWSSDGELFTQEIKNKVKYNPQDKRHIYFSLDYLRKYFKKIIIIYKIFDCNIKQISIKEESLRYPQVFNLYIPSDSKVAFSLLIKYRNSSLYNTNKKICPCSICISQYNTEEKKFINFDGTFSSDESGPQTCRNLKSGFYLVWTYLAYDFCSEPKPIEYELKVNCNAYFKLRIKNQDIKYHLIKNILYSGIQQYQSQFFKEDEITVMDDNFYNFSGLGFKFITNPFTDCFQKWIFKSQVNNMALLYPYSKFEHFEIQVLPKNFFLLLGIKINNEEIGKMELKSYFKTIKYDENSVNQIKNSENIKINFEEYCSNDVENDEKDFKYYKYLNDDGANLESEEFREDKIIYDHLYKNYTIYMDKIKELPVLNKKEEKNLKFFEIKNLDGIYVGQVNLDNKKWGRGALINNNGNYFVGYWKNDKKNGKGTEYSKEGEIVNEGEYKNGTLLEKNKMI